MFEQLLLGHLNLIGGALLAAVFYVCTISYATPSITNIVSLFSESTRARLPRFPDLGIPDGQGLLTYITGLKATIIYTYTPCMRNMVGSLSDV